LPVITLDSGTARGGQGGTDSSITLAATASSSNNDYVGCKIDIISGTGTGQEGIISSYDGSTKIAKLFLMTTASGWTTVPDDTSVYTITKRGGKIILAEGTFICGGSVILNQPGLVLEGQYKGTILKSVSGSNATIIKSPGIVHISGIYQPKPHFLNNIEHKSVADRLLDQSECHPGTRITYRWHC
jgi:hypothetical protein